jgi:hypothetical protein
MQLENFVIGSCNRKLYWRSVQCNTRMERVLENVFVFMCDILMESG